MNSPPAHISRARVFSGAKHESVDGGVGERIGTSKSSKPTVVCNPLRRGDDRNPGNIMRKPDGDFNVV